MAQDQHRQVSIARDAAGKYTVTNERGGTIGVGTGGDGEFTPVELLLAAIGACTSIDVDVLERKRRPHRGRKPATMNGCRSRCSGRLRSVTVPGRRVR